MTDAATQPAASSGAVSPGGGLTQAEFASRFTESFRLLWVIAAGVTGDRALAEDVVQESAVIALGKLDSFDPGSNFAAWMGQMVRFVALNSARKEQRRRGVALDGMDSEPAASASPPAPASAELAAGRLAADQPHFGDELAQALESVPETARACLLLRTLEGLEYTEIAVLLGIPEGTAMSHVHRTRQRLRQRLAPLSGPAGGSV